MLASVQGRQIREGDWWITEKKNKWICHTGYSQLFPHLDCWQWCCLLGMLTYFWSPLIFKWCTYLIWRQCLKSIKSDFFIFLISLLSMNMNFFLFSFLVTLLLISKCIEETECKQTHDGVVWYHKGILLHLSFWRFGGRLKECVVLGLDCLAYTKAWSLNTLP